MHVRQLTFCEASQAREPSRGILRIRPHHRIGQRINALRTNWQPSLIGCLAQHQQRHRQGTVQK